MRKLIVGLAVAMALMLGTALPAFARFEGTAPQCLGLHMAQDAVYSADHNGVPGEKQLDLLKATFGCDGVD